MALIASTQLVKGYFRTFPNLIRTNAKDGAQVNVIHGCNEKCTYCVVPNTRGIEQSRTPEAIKVNFPISGHQKALVHRVRDQCM